MNYKFTTMKKTSFKARVLLFLVVAAIAFSACSKKTCPAYSQLNNVEQTNRA